MFAERIASLFKSLPQGLKQHLLAGAVHPGHLLRITQQVLEGSGSPRGKEIVSAAHPLATSLAAWAENPVSGILAANVLTLAGSLPGLKPETQQVLSQVAVHWNQPETAAQDAPDASAPLPEQLAYVHTKARKEPGSLYWKERVVSLARQMGRMGLVRDTLAAPSWPEKLESVRDLVLAESSLAMGDAQEAVRLYSKHRSTFAQLFDSRMAESLARSGQREQAASVWLGASLAQPWNVQHLLLLHDLAAGVRQETAPLGEKLVILLYSFNNQHEIDNTLSSLAGTELQGARIIALDNGSSDGTGRVMHKWQDQLGAERMEVVELPVNVGAPGARNWLMALDAVRESDFVAYLDDDVELSSDWLGKLGAAVERYPEAGVWGCKVVDHAEPLRIQCAETALLPAQEGMPSLSMWALHEGAPDVGRFDYMRPSASVTGCCHLFRSERLLETGPFDIRFSPTQFDDLDRDLRMVGKGRYAVYTGHMAVRHKRLSGGMAERSTMEQGNVNGNMQKLYSKHDAAGVEAMRALVAAEQERDLIRKAVWIENNLDV